MIITLVFYYKEKIIPSITVYKSDSLPDYEAMKEYIREYIKLNHIVIYDDRQVYAIADRQHKRMNNGKQRP